MSTDERRPTMEAPHETGSRSRTTLPPAPRSTLDVDLASLSHDARELFYAGLSSGVGIGIEIGRRQRDDEEERAWAPMAAHVRRLGGPLSKPYSAMCELRRDPERAAAARLVEQALGVSV